ncbi:Fluoride-specific ion channel FluC [Salinibacterium sp. NYA9b]
MPDTPDDRTRGDRTPTDRAQAEADELHAPLRRPWYFPRWRRRLRARLPMNSDIEITRTVVGMPEMIRIRPRHLALAALGGGLGAAVRFIIAQTTPIWETLSLGTVVVNIAGPFLLGLLLQTLAERQESRRMRVIRLLTAVGFLGALTSYAQLAVDIVIVSEHHHVLLAVAYGSATLIAGAGAVWLGVFTSKSWYRIVRQHERLVR